MHQTGCSGYRVETGYHCLFPHQHSCNTSKEQNRFNMRASKERLLLQQCRFSTLYWQSLILCKGPNSTIARQVMKGRCGAERQWMNHWIALNNQKRIRISISSFGFSYLLVQLASFLLTNLLQWSIYRGRGHRLCYLYFTKLGHIRASSV